MPVGCRRIGAGAAAVPLRRSRLSDIFEREPRHAPHPRRLYSRTRKTGHKGGTEIVRRLGDPSPGAGRRRRLRPGRGPRPAASAGPARSQERCGGRGGDHHLVRATWRAPTGPGRFPSADSLCGQWAPSAGHCRSPPSAPAPCPAPSGEPCDRPSSTTPCRRPAHGRPRGAAVASGGPGPPRDGRGHGVRQDRGSC